MPVGRQTKGPLPLYKTYIYFLNIFAKGKRWKHVSLKRSPFIFIYIYYYSLLETLQKYSVKFKIVNYSFENVTIVNAQ